MKKHIYLPKSSYWLLLIIISTIIAQSINATTFKEANAKKMLVIATDDYLPDVYFGDEATVPISVLLSNDVGTGLQLQSVCTTSQGGGTIVNNGNGTITYTPPSSGPVLGSDSFCYTIIDTNGETATANVIFTFSFDFLLFAQDDIFSALFYGEPVSIMAEELLANDLGEFVQSVCTISAEGGTITDNGDGTFTYLPPAGVSFLESDSFCYTIANLEGYTASATVFLYFTNTNDPQLTAEAVCLYEDEYGQTPLGFFELTITVQGTCDEGYSWINFVNGDMGNVMYDTSLNMGIIYLEGLESDIGVGYSVEVINNCTGASNVIWNVVECAKHTGTDLGYVPIFVNYDTTVIIPEDMIYTNEYALSQWANFVDISFCETSENGGSFINNGDGTFIYTPPAAVNILSDQVCVTGFYEDNTTTETYIDLLFVNLQDPQVSVSTDCLAENMNYFVLNMMVLGQCEDGYAWVNNNNSGENGTVSNPLQFVLPNATDYNYTFTNNCTGEVVTISGEAPDCEITAYNIDAIDDPQDAVEYGNPVTIVSENLLLNDFGDNIQVQSVCTESVNGGTIVTNNDGTYTYYPPAGVDFLATDSFCYTIIDAYGYTATANVILYFYNNNNGQDPIIFTYVSCQSCDNGNATGYFDIAIELVGYCDEGYTWINNLNPSENGDVIYSGITNMGYFQIYDILAYVNGYDISITNNCTGEITTVTSEVVSCKEWDFFAFNYYELYLNYAQQIEITEAMLYENNSYGYYFLYEYESLVFCETSENGGNFTDNGDGTFLYEAPVGVDSLLLDKICVTLVFSDGTTIDTYVEMVFTNIQDPQFDIEINCCHQLENEVKVVYYLKGACEEGYYWVNNNNPAQNGNIYSFYDYFNYLPVIFPQEEGYNYTFTNNCTGEVVSISGEAPDCEITAYNIDAIDDPQDAVEYGNPVTVVSENLLLNDFGDNIQVQSVCTESVNGGTIVNNGDGTYTYYTPAGVDFLATDSFCYTIIDAYGYTATANVILYFYESQQDPTLSVSTECIYCGDYQIPIALFNLTIIVIGSCEEGYTWVNNLNPNEQGEVMYEAGVGYVFLPNLQAEGYNYSNGDYNITVTNECTGEMTTVSSSVDCIIATGPGLGYIPVTVDYATQILITQEMFDEYSGYFFGFSYSYENAEFCTVSENGGTFTDNGDGTYLYTAPLGVDSLFSDIICVSIYDEESGYTEETYLELIFVDIQDPQLETGLFCCGENDDAYINIKVKGVCGEGYTWVNNNDTTQGGLIYSYISNLTDLSFFVEESQGYNYTFTNNCTGEVVTISGEAPDCEITAYIIDAIDDPQDAVEYGN
ncbi:MAG: tandem-95 repeat protein, partial [Bacteroidetes bacterium]|nr:tandem-95 repeat protein [Bacteroidota bacterium]